MTRRVQVDFDDTIKDGLTAICRFINQRVELDRQLSKTQCAEFTDAYFLGRQHDPYYAPFLEEYIEKFDDKHDHNGGPLEGAHAGLMLLVESGYEIHLASARPKRDSMQERMVDWLQHHDLLSLITKIHFYPGSELGSKGSAFKRQVAESIGAAAAIDDHYPTSLTLSEVTPVFLIAHDWNKQHREKNGRIAHVDSILDAAVMITTTS